MTTPLTPSEMKEALRYATALVNADEHDELLTLAQAIVQLQEENREQEVRSLETENAKLRKDLQRIKDSAECRHAIEIASDALSDSPQPNE